MWYWTKVLFLIVVGAVGVWIAYELLTFPNISSLRTENPVTTSMIEYRLGEARAAGREPRKFMIWMPLEQISQLVGHSGATVTDLVYRHQLRPVIQTGAIVMDQLFSGNRRQAD